MVRHQADDSARGLARCRAGLRRFNAMVTTVAYQMDQRIPQAFDHGLVQLGLSALGH